jgi:hypothetical protein
LSAWGTRSPHTLSRLKSEVDMEADKLAEISGRLAAIETAGSD